MFKPGDRVVATGRCGRNNPNRKYDSLVGRTGVVKSIYSPVDTSLTKEVTVLIGEEEWPYWFTEDNLIYEVVDKGTYSID